MSRRLLAAAVTAALLGAGITGCGIPDQTDVQVDGRVLEPDYDSDGGSGSQPPKRWAVGEDEPQQFALNFLKAAAGEASGAYDRVKQYIAKDAQSKLKVKQGSDVAINVVRLREPTPRYITEVNGGTTITKITILVEQIGLLKTNGTLAPPVATEASYTFTVGKPVDATVVSGLFVLDPPPVLLLSTDGLKDYYREQTIYFWNVDRSALVPDLRYLPETLPRQARATEVLGWLTGGPADWLAPTVVRLPDGTEAIGNAPQTGSRIVVNLTALPGPDENAELDRLAIQLAWSLRPDLTGELELKIRNQSRKVIADTSTYLKDNPAYQLPASPQQFCVYAGAVYPLAIRGQTVPTVPIVPEGNHDVVSAALARGGPGILAALTVTADGDRRRLLAGSGVDQVRTFARSAQTYASMSQPVWLKAADRGNPVGLVVADGKLYRFGTDAALTRLELNVGGAVTAVGAALDGHRIGFIAGGKLYVAALAVDGGRIAAGPARRLATSLHDLASVAWSRENSLVVAGINARPTISDITVDGALETTVIEDTGGAQVTHLSTYPDNPIFPPAAGRVMYEANMVAVAWRDAKLEQIKRDEVAGAPSPPAGKPGNPTAPFFFY